MAGFNSADVAGNLVRDPEIGKTPSGIPVARATIAVNRTRSTQGGVDYIDVKFWREDATKLAHYKSAGDAVMVKGWLASSTYTDPATDRPRTKVEVNAKHLTFSPWTKIDHNSATIAGNLVRDPELRQTAAGTPVANLVVAVDRGGSRDSATDYLRVKAWGKLAETVVHYKSAGEPVLIDGELRYSAYTDSGGGRRASLELNASDIQFLSAAKSGAAEPATATADAADAEAAKATA